MRTVHLPARIDQGWLVESEQHLAEALLLFVCTSRHQTLNEQVDAEELAIVDCELIGETSRSACMRSRASRRVWLPTPGARLSSSMSTSSAARTVAAPRRSSSSTTRGGNPIAMSGSSRDAVRTIVARSSDGSSS